MRIKITSILFIYMLCFFESLAHNPTSMLFEVEMGDKRFRIFGTLHFSSIEDVPDPVLRKLGENDGPIYVESEAGFLNLRDLYTHIYALRPENALRDATHTDYDPYWFSRLTVSEQESISTLYNTIYPESEYSRPEYSPERYNPVLLSYLMLFEMCKKSPRSGYCLEKQIIDRFPSKPTKYLETVEEHFRNILSFSSYQNAVNWLTENSDALLETYRTPDHQIRESFVQVKEAYRQTNLHALRETATLEQESSNSLPLLLLNSMIEGRNRKWLERLESSAVYCVGALHLPGENGLLNLCSQRGSHISRYVPQTDRFVPVEGPNFDILEKAF